MKMNHTRQKQQFNLMLYVFCLLCISACSSLPFMGDEQVQELSSTHETIPKSDSQTYKKEDVAVLKLTEHLVEWQEIKPSIERLVAIESELKELIKQLNVMVKKQPDAITTNDKLPVNSISSEQSEIVERGSLVEPEASQLMSESANISPAAPQNVNSEYAIQLFSIKDQTLIEFTWNKLLKKHHDKLATLRPIYEEVKVGDSKFYRVKVAGFSSRKETLEMCGKLQLLGTSCIATNSVGIEF